MSLDDLHREWLLLDADLEEKEKEADKCVQRFAEEVAVLVHKENMPKTKAEARIIIEQKDAYELYRETKREYRALERQANRAKSEYYHQRRKEDSGKSLDIEASRGS